MALSAARWSKGSIWVLFIGCGETRVVLAGACFFWSTLSRCGWSSRWCKLCAGAALCEPTAAFGRMSSFAFASFSPGSVFWCSCGVLRLGFFGRSCVLLVRQKMHVLPEVLDDFSHFHVGVDSIPAALCLQTRRMESVHSRRSWLKLLSWKFAAIVSASCSNCRSLRW